MNNQHKNKHRQFSVEEVDRATEILLTDYFDNRQKEKWNNLLAEQYGIHPPQKKRAKRIQLYRNIAAAAVILLLLVAGITYTAPLTSKSPHELYAMHTKIKHPYSNNKKGVGGIITANKRAEGMEAYSEQDYDLAILELTAVINSSEANVDDYLYLGLSYMYNNDSEKAVENFITTRTMLATSKLDDKEEQMETLNWYLSLAYLQGNDLENTKKELKNIIATQRFKKEAAKELLEKL